MASSSDHASKSSGQIPLVETRIPLPPKSADVLTTACDYCIVGCGYKVYRWPVDGEQGGSAAAQNAFNQDFPVAAYGAWVSPSQHSIVRHQGRLHHVVIRSDQESEVVNIAGDHSALGGTLAQKCYREDGPTRDRLQQPLIRINGELTPVSWDMALDVAAALGKHTIAKHGSNAYGFKSFSYQYFENTYGHHQVGLPSCADRQLCLSRCTRQCHRHAGLSGCRF